MRFKDMSYISTTFIILRFPTLTKKGNDIEFGIKLDFDE